MITLDVRDIGYEISVPLPTCLRLTIGQPILLHTHLIVREDAHTLYGFTEPQEKLLFQQLLRVSGIGPKSALTIMSGVSVPAFIDILQEKSVDFLVKIPGIGKKTAERILVDFDGKRLISETSGLRTPLNAAKEDAHAALIRLGYSVKETDAALKRVPDSVTQSDEILKLILKEMAKW